MVKWSPLLLARKHRDIMHIATMVDICKKDIERVGESFPNELEHWKEMEFTLELLERRTKDALEVARGTPREGESSVGNSSNLGVY